MEIEELIQQGKELKRDLQCHYSDFGNYYTHTDNNAYERWLALTRRYLKTYYSGDDFIPDFEKAAKEIDPSPEQMDKMLAILDALDQLPEVVKTHNEKSEPRVTINNTQLQSQSQSQNVMLKVFVEALHEELSGKQIRELKSVAEDENLNEEEKKSTILDKIKEFGKDTLASIVANVLTNPTIWGMM